MGSNTFFIFQQIIPLILNFWGIDIVWQYWQRKFSLSEVCIEIKSQNNVKKILKRFWVKTFHLSMYAYTILEYTRAKCEMQFCEINDKCEVEPQILLILY